MKTQNNIRITIAGLMIILLLSVSCSKDFLEVESKGTSLEGAFYKNESDATSALVAVYDIMNVNSSSFANIISFMNAGSDDNFGGGGPGEGSNTVAQFSSFGVNPINMNDAGASGLWSNHFQGIFRANTLLQKLPSISMDDNLKIRYAAECKAMRAYYNFNLVRMFGNIPLLTKTITPTDALTYPQSKPEEIYAQIEIDLKEAITGLPDNVNILTEGGRWTKGAAQAMLGKVYIYEKKNADAAAQLAIVNGTNSGIVFSSPYGYKLLTDFQDLWVHTNKFNSECILSDSHSKSGNATWDGVSWGTEGTVLNVMVGIRGYTRSTNSTAPDYYAGWGYNTVSQDLYDVLKGDPRFDATIIDAKALKASGKIVGYTVGTQDTGYFIAKFAPKNSDKTGVAAAASELNFAQNTYIIRLADTYLLEAEALGGTGARAQALLDAVRARVGLSSVPVTIGAIALERRKELACEGHRFFDLVRTGKAETVLAGRGFVKNKNEILPIPYRDLENSVLKQNPGY
jgi:hypothetical protein